jgi:hypothetical protein
MALCVRLKAGSQSVSQYRCRSDVALETGRLQPHRNHDNNGTALQDGMGLLLLTLHISSWYPGAYRRCGK